MTASNRRSPRGTLFPIVEVFGFPHDSSTPEALTAWDNEYCPFSESKCEKKIQYNYGYCSVVYSAQWDQGQPQPYAVCDHRLDGDPVRWAINDHFGSQAATLVPEVTATSAPKLNVDYVAYRDDSRAEEGVDMIAIETQAIDLRGGGVGPAWRAWKDKNVANWRDYFSEEAARKGRRDTVDYGINTGNVYKRLGTQVAIKGEYLKRVHVPLYVITQDRILKQLRLRVNFKPVSSGVAWDITFASFDYLGMLEKDGRLSFGFIESVRTTLPNYLEALTSSDETTEFQRADFVARVRRKASLARHML